MFNDKTNKLIELIYDSAINPSKWTELLNTVAEFVDYVEKNSDNSDYNMLSVIPSIATTENKNTHTSLSQTLKSITTLEDSELENQSITTNEINELLMGHFARALKIAKRLIDVDEQHNVVLSLLDRMPVALVLVDKNSRVIETNALADEMFNDKGGLSIKSDVLDFGSINNSRVLEAIEQMSKHDSAITRGQTLSITNEETKNNIMLFIAPLRQQGVERNASVAIFISQRKSIPLSLPREFSDLYGLTAKEIVVTQQLVRGLSINEISEESSVSLHTVRSHVKSVMKKTSTSRQAELVSLVYNGIGGFVNSIPEIKVEPRNGLLTKTQLWNQDYSVLRLSDGRNLSYTEYGDPKGEPVFHCHCVLGSRLELSFNSEEISKEKKVRLIVMDRPGYGASDLNTKASFINWVSDLEELADHLKIEKFSLTGYAMGGVYVLACAHEIPKRLKKVVIISNGMPPESVEDYKTIIPLYKVNNRLAKHLPKVYSLVTSVLVKGILSDPATFFKQFSEQVDEADREIIYSEEFKSTMFISLKESFRLGGKAASKEVVQFMHDWGFKLENISIPVDIWHGTSDYHVPIALGERLAEHIKHTKLFIKENQGHFLFYTHWAEILDELLVDVRVKICSE